MKVLNLVLFSHNSAYDKMYSLTRSYYEKIPNLTTIYYIFNPDIQSDYLLENDILHIKGKETYVPGILTKTIRAFEYALTMGDFDYIVRTNISTVVNFSRLMEYLEKNPANHAGMRNRLEGTDKKAGIIDSRYFNTEYASGTCIIYTKDLLQKIITSKDKLDYSIIDDVALGLLVKSLGEKIVCIRNFYGIIKDRNTLEKIAKDFIIFRNRSANRRTDVTNIQNLIQALEKSPKLITTNKLTVVQPVQQIFKINRLR